MSRFLPVAILSYERPLLRVNRSLRLLENHVVKGAKRPRLCENSPKFGVHGTAPHIEQILNIAET